MGATETNAQRLMRCIDVDDPSVILVNYFDTLVTRSITGEQIKRVSARFIRERFALEASLDEIHRCRLDVEVELRRAAQASGLDPEHRLDDLADGLWHRVGSKDADGQPIDRHDFRAGVMAIEMSIERAAQTLDADVVDVLRKVSGERRLMIVSDSHIPTPWFNEMVAHHGIADLFEQIIVSCDQQRSKASGRLYEHVLDVAITPAERLALGGHTTVLMVGDHPVSDGMRAHEHGLATCRLAHPPATPPNRFHERWRRDDIAHRRNLRQIVTRQPEGFGELAVTVYAFTRALHAKASSEKAEQLTFLAREGKILRDLFVDYDATTPAVADQHIDTNYLIVSRRSTYLPSLRPLDEEDFSRLIRLYPTMNETDLLSNLGLHEDEQLNVLAELGSSTNQGLDLDGLRRSPTLRRCYTDGHDTQKARLIRLIDELVGEGSPLHIVDVGWKATMQDHLQRIVGPSRTITGYYLGIVPGRHMLDEGTKFGLLFDGRSDVTPAQRTLRHFKSIYEFLLQADHGSARRYLDIEGQIQAELDDQDLEAQVYDDHIGPVQRQLRDLFHQICVADALSEKPMVGDLDDVARLHQRMLFFPTRDEIARILAIRHYENFGPLGFVGGTGSDSAGTKLRRAATLLRHPKEMVANGWPPLTLVSAGLGQLVPVVGSYRWLRGRFDAAVAGRNES